MIKKLIVAFATVVSLATFAPSAYAVDTKLMEVIKAVPQIDDNCSASVVYSKRDEKSGDVKTVLLTAKHCLADYKATDDLYADFLQYQNNRVIKKNRFMAHKLGEYYKADIALLELVDKKTLFEDVVKLSDGKDIQMGDETVTIGYPLGVGINFTEGHFMSVVHFSSFMDNQEFLHATPDVGPGNSGGPLMKKMGDGSYEQIGLTTGVINGFPFSGVYTGIDDIREYLKTALPEATGEKVITPVVSPAGH